MYKLWATILKDLRILARDKVGLTFMFGMPIILAIVITALQNSTFELVNDNKVPLLLCNRDTGDASKQLVVAIEKVGLFKISKVGPGQTNEKLTEQMHSKDALIAIIIPTDFSKSLTDKAKNVSGKALKEFGMAVDSLAANTETVESVTMMYHPVLQESFRQSIKGALRSSLQLVASKQILKSLYFSLNEKEMPQTLEDELISNEVPIEEIPISRDGTRTIPNSTQHNIPAWTIFAMFFVVISLGSSVVKEKLNGSFVRLKTLPTNYLVALLSKQLTYLVVTLAQAAVIFSIGIWLFPHLGLPKLQLPDDLFGLLLVSLISGWCAVSFAICVGIFAQTQEQANGIGAVSIVLLAAIGGLLVPSFAMPESFRTIIKLSPLHWCLEAFYGLFLEGGKLRDILTNILPLILITLVLQGVALAGLKTKNLI
jgi:ABC-2 type transport system permease protein